MSTIVGAIMTSHSPSIMTADDAGKHGEAEWQPLFKGLAALHRWLEKCDPELLVVVTSDHVSHFHLRYGWPTFAVAAAKEYPIADEGGGLRDLPPIPGDRAFALALAEQMVELGIDLSVAHEYHADHGIHSPLPLINDTWRWPIVILHLNTLFAPLPTTQRVCNFGTVLGQALRQMKIDRRVALVGLGGMSHELVGPMFGRVEAEWDRECMDMIVEDPKAFLKFTARDLAEKGGSEGLEIYHWLAVRCALGDQPRLRVKFYYPHRRMGYGGLGFEPQ